jgi:hypothetical protein
MSLGEQLKEIIERYANNIMANSTLIEKAQKGTLKREQIGLYLFNLYFILSHSPVHTYNAKKVALKKGWTDLADFLEELIDFEKGHDDWAVDDLENFGLDEMLIDKFSIVPATKELAAYLHEISQRRPHSYVAYHFYSAYMALLIGPQFLNLLQLNCGISISEISIMTKYQLLDDEYNFNDFTKVESFTDGLIENRVVADLEVINKCFTLFFNEIAETVIV